MSPDIDQSQKVAEYLLDSVAQRLLEERGEAEIKIASVLQAEGIAPLLHHLLSQEGLPHTLTVDVEDAIKSLTRTETSTLLGREQEVSEVLKAVTSEGLPFVVLKGEALAHSVYPTPYTRMRCDIDILFRDKDHMGVMIAFLRSRGYTISNVLDGEFVGRQVSCEKVLQTGSRASFDIHCAISDYIWLGEKLSFDEIHREAISIEIGDAKAMAPCAKHALVHAVIHRIANRPFDTHNRLIWLYDIYLLLLQFDDTELVDIVEDFGRKSLARPLKDSLASTERNIGYAVPDKIKPLLESLAEKEDSAIDTLTSRSRLYYYDFKALGSTRDRATMLREHTLPSARYMRTKYKLGSSNWQLPYYYAKRLFLGARRYF